MDHETQQMARIQRIIALKRFEQPPPGYFHLLPNRIMTRIENGEGQESFWDQLLPSFSIRPIWACAIGFSFCAAVAVGSLYPLASDATVADTNPISQADLIADASPALDSTISSDNTSAAGLHVVNNWNNGSSAGVVTTRGSLEPQEALALPVSFNRGN